jgi:hypothetical protein
MKKGGFAGAVSTVVGVQIPPPHLYKQKDGVPYGELDRV